MFIAILTYKKPLSEVINIFRHTVIILLSIMPPETSSHQDREAVSTIISQDPFNTNGIADYQIVEFTPTMFCDESLQTHF